MHSQTEITMVAITVDSLSTFAGAQTATKFASVSITAFSALLAFNANAADWKFIPTVNLTESYSDNIKLAPKEAAQSAFVSQVSPGLSVSATGQRLKLQANYVMDNSFYSGSDTESKINHLLHANANATLIEELFFLDGNASITQQNLSPFGTVTDNNINISNNRVEVKTYNVAPYFRRKFDNDVTAELRYSRDSVSSDSTLSQDSTGDNLRFSINSGSAFKTLSWGLLYNHQNVDYERQIPLKTEMTTINLGYALSSMFKLTGTGGYENNNYLYQGSQASGYFGTLGFAWTPTERTNIVFNSGQRFYGKTRSLSINQRARMSIWSLGYNEDVTTTREQFLVPATISTSNFLNQLWKNSIPDPALRQQMVDSFIRDSALPSSLSQPINTFSNQVFLQKTLQGSVALTGVQNTAVFSAFSSSREALTKIEGNGSVLPTQAGDIKQSGINALWNIKLSPRTNISASAGYNKSNQINSGVKDNTTSLKASISRQLQPKVRAMLEARHQHKNSNFSLGNYDENAISLYLFLGF
jgi:uncharacterized protein (PEP-CTERM system associated)